jgi:hypothetical protein
VVAGAGVFVAVVALAGSSGANEPAIAGIKCDRTEHIDDYHVHVRLELFIQGVQREVSPDVGIKQGECYYWLHTHSPGLIHVEAPADMGFTLGQFFAVWGQPLSSTQLLDKRVDDSHEIRATVGTTRIQGDPALIPLDPDAFIRLEYGPPFQE